MEKMHDGQLTSGVDEMLTTATEKVKLWRFSATWHSNGRDEPIVKYFTNVDEGIEKVKFARANPHMYSDSFLDEVTAVVTFNK